MQHNVSVCIQTVVTFERKGIRRKVKQEPVANVMGMTINCVPSLLHFLVLCKTIK